MTRADSLHNGESLNELVPALYGELRAAAKRALRYRRCPTDGTPTLQTTGLVSEAYLRLAGQSRLTWKDREHFLSVAAVAMRHILVDRARARMTLKRGGGVRPDALEEDLYAIDEDAELVLAIDAALAELAALNPRLSKIIELRFFGGLGEEEAAAVLDVNVRTVQRDWAKARVLLRYTLEVAGLRDEPGNVQCPP
jgi:RNA polymerase sigma factor (TIGR02999 family)